MTPTMMAVLGLVAGYLLRHFGIGASALSSAASKVASPAAPLAPAAPAVSVAPHPAVPLVVGPSHETLLQLILAQLQGQMSNLMKTAVQDALSKIAQGQPLAAPAAAPEQKG